MVIVKVGLMSNPISKPAGLPLLSIGTVARLTGKSAPAIRYYEQIGLLPEPARVSGRRRYAPDTVRTLAVIETGQRAGLTLDEIKVLLSASPGDPAAIDRLREVADRKLPEVIALIERGQLVRSWLECAARCECPDLDQCPLFDDPALPPRHDAAPARRRRSPKPNRPLPSDAPAGPVTAPGLRALQRIGSAPKDLLRASNKGADIAGQAVSSANY
jgi:MerR family transcriptional regulator, redox-sensitive transcriptional activator SoxR